MDRQAKAARRVVEMTCPPAAMLSDDMLAEVLCRLAPRFLAASRGVCKAWRDIIDSRRLLRTELLPLSPGGIFLNFNKYYVSEFFARPSTSTARPSISGKHDYLPDAGSRSWSEVLDHCNGLVLVASQHLEYVLNPATRRCARLPPCPVPRVQMNSIEYKYLVYDPTISPHYQVFSVTRFETSYSNEPDPDPALEQTEWPPSIFYTNVYSSMTGCWEERSFAREGEAVCTVADMRQYVTDQHNVVYWRGALYVHCHTDFVMRLSLSDNKYQTIKPPWGLQGRYYPQIYLGKSERGVYCASIHGRCRIRVWLLIDRSSCNNMEWLLIHDTNLIEWLFSNELKHRGSRHHKVVGPWILDDINYYFERRNKDDGGMEVLIGPSKCDNEDKVYDSDDSMVGEKTGCMISEPLVEEKLIWSFNSDFNRLNGKLYNGYLKILGFHPYKEIVFLGESMTRGLAYHLKSSKVQILGNLYPARYDEELGNEQQILLAFVYTPCWLSDTDSRE